VTAPRRLALVVVVFVGACAGVLGLRRTVTPAAFPHRAHVLKGISCVECHTKVAKDGDTDPVELPSDASCLTCHQKPHDTRSCAGCHGSPANEGGAIEARQHLKFAHVSHLALVQGDCVRCHTGIREDGVALRPQMATCLSCHAHREQFEPTKCELCHADLETERVLPASHIVHDDAWLRNHGNAAASAPTMCATCHTQASCAHCHGATTAALPAHLAFDDTTSNTIHRAGFRARHAEEAHAAPGTCNACHSESSCRTCHEHEGVAATVTTANPHPPGWVGVGPANNAHGREARRDPAACAGCHSGAGEQLCVSCHKVGGVGGNPHPPGWHSRQPMSALPCRLCHAP
jgi:hypothetical protein